MSSSSRYSPGFPSSLSLLFQPKSKKFSLSPLPRRKPRVNKISALSIGLEDIAQLAHNKVLVAASVAATIGQLSKPFTSAIRGDGFNLKSVVQSGGMPSTHSASVVAAATSLGLERGFSDSIFGMTAVFAALVMYDSQGVRREVGTHAKLLNDILKAEEKKALHREEEEASIDSRPESSVYSEEFAPSLSLSEKKSYTSSQSYPLRGLSRPSSKLDAFPSLKINGEAVSKKLKDYRPLNESVGHTEIQVIVGALLGFIASVAVNAIL